jgi:hypothetical protein
VRERERESEREREEREERERVSVFISAHMFKSFVYINLFAPRDFPVPTKYVKKNTPDRNTHTNTHSNLKKMAGP